MKECTILFSNMLPEQDMKYLHEKSCFANAKQAMDGTSLYAATVVCFIQSLYL